MPYKDQFDEEVILSWSDWYNDSPLDLGKRFLSVANPSGAEPVPSAALMNDTQNLKIKIQPGKTYLFRMINMGAFAAQHVWFEGHTMKIVEVDGVYTEPTDADMIYMTVAQRYSVLITAKNGTGSNFPIIGSMDQDLFDAVPPGLNPNVTGWLVYDDSKPFPDPAPVEGFNDFDDFTLVPHDKLPRFPAPDRTLTMTFLMDNLKDGAN
jgi:iron transport multicopper oxidase